MIKRGFIGLALVLMFLLFSVGVIAQGSLVLPPSYQGLIDNIDVFKKQIDEKDVQLPPGVGTIFRNDVLKINIERYDSSDDNLGIIVKDKSVVDIVHGTPTSPTIVIDIKEQIIDAVLADENPVAALEYVFNAKLISYRGVSFASRLKVSVIKNFLKVISLFTGRGTTTYDLKLPNPPVIVKPSANLRPVPSSPSPAQLRVVALDGACNSDLECSGGPACVGNICECSEGSCKVAPGYVCNHGGECSTGFCLGRPSDQGIEYFCSCRQDRHDANC